MKKGRIKISPGLITDALNFPPDWKIEALSFNEYDSAISAIISGNDFPEVQGNNIKECRIIVHKEQISFEVKEI